MLEVFNIDWPAHRNVNAITTTRLGGISRGVYRGLNLGNHVNDEKAAVEHNRKLLRTRLNLVHEPKWLNQVHGVNIVNADELFDIAEADGSYTTKRQCICAILTADCLPVFLSDLKGSTVGLFHAGWRGLADGILRKAVNAMNRKPAELIAAVGPAISQDAFEVGLEVKQQFESSFNGTSAFFAAGNEANKYYADLYGLARTQLYQLGVTSVWLPHDVCTYNDSHRFYSFRRDGQTGRMASLIWMS